MNRGAVQLWLGGGFDAACSWRRRWCRFVWTPLRRGQRCHIPDKLPPGLRDHLLGTDHFGRDILSMLMVGARTSIAVALVAVGIGMALGVPLGLLGRRATAAR